MKILSIDGGGLKGVGPASMLVQAGDLSKFDLFVGTSIGSAIAALAAMGRIDNDLINLFLNDGASLFKKRHRDRIRPWRTPKYCDDGLNTMLMSLLPGKMGDMPKPFAATAINMNRRNLRVFSSLSYDDVNWDVWQVCRMSSAAQTYFSPWNGYSDGGPMANNPVMVGIREASKHMHARIDDIEVLSIGTGEAITNYTVDSTVGWPLWKWGMWLIPALLEGSGSNMHTEFARSLRLKKFVRIEYNCDPEWAMDDPKTPKLMVEKLGGQFEVGAARIRDF